VSKLNDKFNFNNFIETCNDREEYKCKTPTEREGC